MPDIPCPHCGQLNESEREVCWACCNLLKPGDARPKEAPPAGSEIPGSDPVRLPIPDVPLGSGLLRRTRTTKIVVDGKEYADLGEVPEPFRSSLRNSLADARQAMSTGKKSRIVVNGREYARVEDVPEEFRAKLKDAMAHAKVSTVQIGGAGRPKFRIGPLAFSGHGRYVAEPLDMDPDAPLEPPEGFRFEDLGQARRISWRWISWEAMKGILFAVIFGVPFAFILYAYLHTPAHKPWPMQAMAFLIGFGIPPAAIVYTWLCYLLNRTTVFVDATRVSVQHGPLPCWGGKDVARAEIARVLSERVMYASSDSSDGTMFEPEVTYRVSLALKDGKTAKLVTGLLSPEQAMFLEQQIRRAC